MPYILKKTDGTTLTTVNDASIDNTTNLIFVGRNYSGYGQPVEENLVKLLENFSNTTRPTRPVQGQLWFDNNPSVRRIKYCFDGSNFKDISNTPYGETPPLNASTGDLWWDSFNNQIKVYNSVYNTWTASQPYGGASSRWDFARIEDINAVDHNAIEGYILNNQLVVFSDSFYKPSVDSGFSTNFPAIKAGINLHGANPITGKSASSTSTGYLFWGTAADALSTDKVTLSTTTNTSVHYIPFSIGATGPQSLYTDSNFYLTPSTGVLNVTAARSLYADLAERYAADAVYDEGTVLVIGGEKEVTLPTEHAMTAVAGVVSKNPAYLMNSAAGNDETHPAIALKGRIPCKVIGFIKKGDMLVTSGHKPGYATAWKSGDDPNAVIGKALEDFEGSFGIIEIKV